MRSDALRRRVLRLASLQQAEAPRAEPRGSSVREQLLADDPPRLAQLVEVLERIDSSRTPCSRHMAERGPDEDEPEVDDDFEHGINLLRDSGLVESDCRWCAAVAE